MVPEEPSIWSFEDGKPGDPAARTAGLGHFQEAEEVIF